MRYTLINTCNYRDRHPCGLFLCLQSASNIDQVWWGILVIPFVVHLLWQEYCLYYKEK